MENKSASQILNEAADLLEREDRWGKGNYFQENISNPEKGCLMCAHGAIAYCGSKEVRDKIIYGNLNTVGAAGFARTAAERASRAAGAVAGSFCYYDYDNFYKTKYPHLHQTFLAHYKAIKAGLTFGYNDNPSTTKQDVINKLREAASLYVSIP